MTGDGICLCRRSRTRQSPRLSHHLITNGYRSPDLADGEGVRMSKNRISAPRIMSKAAWGVFAAGEFPCAECSRRSVGQLQTCNQA